MIHTKKLNHNTYCFTSHVLRNLMNALSSHHVFTRQASVEEL